MKQFYLFLLSVLAMVGIVPAAQAGLPEGHYYKITWNVPDGLELREESYNGTKIDIPSGATSYIYSQGLDDWDDHYSFYLCATGDYKIASCHDSSGNTYTPKTNYAGTVSYVEFREYYESMSGLEITVELAKPEMDSKLTVNLVNGVAQDFSIKFKGTGRTVKINKTGINEIDFSSVFESTIQLNYEGKASELSECTLNGGESLMEEDFWNEGAYVFPGTLNIADGDVLYIKWSDTPDPSEGPALVPITVNFTNDTAKAALQMAFDTTKFSAITNDVKSGRFEVEEGNKIRFTFNTKDYDVTLMEGDWEKFLTENGNYSTYEFTADEAKTFTISASEKVYDDIELTFYTIGAEGGIFTDMNTGEAIDLGAYTPESYAGSIDLKYYDKTIDGTKVTTVSGAVKYTVPVSSKNPKISVDAKDGWTVLYAVKGTDISDVLADDAGYIMLDTDNPAILYVFHKIEATEEVCVYLKGNAENVKLTDNLGDVIPLTEGHNTITIDPAAQSPFTVRYYNYTKASENKLYVDGVAKSLNTNEVFMPFNVQAGSNIKLFEKSTPATHNVTFVTDHNSSVVHFDNLVQPTYHNSTLSTVEATHVVITPRQDAVVEIDGQSLLTRAADKVEFITSGDHTVSVTYAGTDNVPVVTPANGAVLNEDISEITIAFPAANIVDLKGTADEIMFRATDNSYAPISTSLEVKEGTNNTYVLTLNPAASAAKTYSLYVPAGLFELDNDLTSTEISCSYTIEKDASDFTWIWSTSEDDNIVANEYGGPTVAIMLDDESLQISDVDPSKITVTFAGAAVPYTASYEDNGYVAEAYENFLSIGLMYDYRELTGVFKVDLAEGAFKVGNTESPAISGTWNVVMPKEFTYTLTPSNNKPVAELQTITITFNEAENAVVYRASGAELKKSDYSYNHTATSIEKVEGSNNSFNINFPATTTDGTYELSIHPTTFTLDGQECPQISLEYTVDKSVGVNEIVLNGADVNVIISIDGRVIKNRSEMELDGGVYIINGKKTIHK